MKRKWLWITVAGSLFLSACGSTRIRHIVQDPARYDNRDVQVEGRVTRSVGAVVAGAYTVEDGTGSITVISTRPVPPPGAEVRVKGRVQSGVNIMGRSFGTTLRERDVDVKRR